MYSVCRNISIIEKKSMKIALTTDGIFPFVIGGMQKHSYYLCKYLAKLNVEIYLFTPPIPDRSKLNEYFTTSELEYINIIEISTKSMLKLPGHYIRQSLDYAKKIEKYIKNNNLKVDFIYTKGLSGYYVIEHKSKMTSKTPIGINIHGYEMFQKPPNFKSYLQQFMLRPYFKKINQNTDFILSYGGKITDLIVQKLNQPRKKVIEIPTGIDEDWLIDQDLIEKIENRETRFVFVGRYESRKGIKELQLVLNQMLDQNLSFQFTFIGPIPESVQIASPRIKYMGQLTDVNDIKQILTTSDVLVVPSHSEGMPNVIVEAMARGCAVIATDVGAVSLMVKKNTGWLIPPFDSKILYEVMYKVIQTSPQELKLIQKEAFMLVRNMFLWSRVAEITKSKLEKIISEFPK